MRIEETILRNLIYNDDYTRRVLPFLDNKYFHDFNEKILFEEIAKHISKYNNCPTRETLEISLGGLDTVTEDQFKDLVNSVVEMEKVKDDDVDIEWLPRTLRSGAAFSARTSGPHQWAWSASHSGQIVGVSKASLQ